MQEIELQKFKEDYDASPLLVKRAMVLDLLDSLRGRGQIFDDFYQFISRFPDDVAPFELDQIFQIILVAIYTDVREKLQEVESRLQAMKDTVAKMREREKEERERESPESDLALQFSNL